MFNLSKVLNAIIDRIHERGLRIVYEDYTSTYDDLLKRDGSVRIHHKNIQLVAVEMFKVKNDLCPELMKCLFRINPNPRDGHTFIIPNVNSEYMGKLSLCYFGPVVWETMLPEKYKKILTLAPSPPQTPFTILFGKTQARPTPWLSSMDQGSTK